MLVILLNCVTLGMYQPCVDDQCISRRCRILQVNISSSSFIRCADHVSNNKFMLRNYFCAGFRRLHIRILLAGNDRENDRDGRVRTQHIPRRLLEQIGFLHRDRGVCSKYRPFVYVLPRFM